VPREAVPCLGEALKRLSADPRLRRQSASCSHGEVIRNLHSRDAAGAGIIETLAGAEWHIRSRRVIIAVPELKVKRGSNVTYSATHCFGNSSAQPW